MEDKSSSALAANDSGFVQSKASDDDLESAAFGGGGSVMDGDGIGQSTGKVTKTAVVVGPAASWLEFTDWLERGLDDCGLEPTLYARCVLSILKQPPEPAADMSIDHEDEWIPTAATNLLSVVSHLSAGKNNSAPSSRKNSFSSLAGAAATINASTTIKTDHDTRKQALMDCLKTVNSDEADLEKFVDDIVQRYATVCKSGVLGEKQNESVDSGVCPSPEESFQNYDEAFPPLATDRSFDGSTMDVFVGENVGIRPRVASSSSSWSNGKRPAEACTKPAISACGISVPMLDDDMKIDDGQEESTGTQGDGSPVKRPKLLADLIENENGGRALHSCPDFVHSAPITPSNPVCAGKRATFCCPVVKKQTSAHQVAVGMKIPPQFVIPKFWKVGSWPSRYDRSTKPAGDVPFWSCSEWFCTVHKRLEFGMLNAKINGDTMSLAAAPPASAPITMNSSCCGGDRTTSGVNIDAETQGAGSYMDVDIFEIEPSLPSTALQQRPLQPQQIWNKGQQQQPEIEQQSAQVVPEMFDAPRFILHIINEDDGANKETFFPSSPKQSIAYPSINYADENASPALDWASLFDQGAAENMLFTASQQQKFDGQYGNGNGSPWNATMAKSEFSFDTVDDMDTTRGNIDLATSTGILLPLDISQTTPGEVGFCLPRCGRLPVVAQQQQQRQPQPQLLAPPTNAAIGLFNKILENQAVGGAEFSDNVVPKKQPQSVAVPIKDSTHFQPIRSESMEDAYFLKPGFDEFCEAIENIEDYYVYQHDCSGASDTIVQAATAQAVSTDVKEKKGEPRRSLTLKFRAAKPDKMCQTEEFGADLLQDLAESDENAADVTTLLERYRQEFEIWAFQPAEIRNRLNVDVSRWNLDSSTDSTDAMVVGALSPQIDTGWLNELVGGDSPPPQPVQSKTSRDENPFSQELREGVLVDTTVFPQQQHQSSAPDGQQQLEIWQQEDERYEDSLLRYVSNISLISPLDIQTTTV